MITRREANSGLLASVFRGAVDYKKARPPIATSRGRIRHLCPDRRLRAWVNT